MDPRTAARWTSALARPFYKANARGVRPVISSDTRFKGAVAAAVKANLPRMGPAFGPFQYGAGRAGGVDQGIYDIRAAVRAQDSSAPDPAQQWGIVALDRTNAFGDVHWVFALEIATEKCPAVAPC